MHDFELSMAIFATICLFGCGSSSTTTDAGTDARSEASLLDNTVDVRLDTLAADVATDSGSSDGRADAVTNDATVVDAVTADSARDATTRDGGACVDQDARGEGSCRTILGYRFAGSTCTAVSGCTCVGADCGALFGDENACFAANRVCLFACPEQSIAGAGLCDQVLGYRWNGTACETVSGCSCSGRQCTSIYPSSTACEADHQQCGTRDCRTDGCDEGTCQICSGSYQCVADVADGAAC